MEKTLFQSYVPSATVTQHTGAKIFESNFIFWIEYIKSAVTTHSTQGEKKKTSVPSQKVTARGPERIYDACLTHTSELSEFNF